MIRVNMLRDLLQYRVQKGVLIVIPGGDGDDQIISHVICMELERRQITSNLEFRIKILAIHVQVPLRYCTKAFIVRHNSIAVVFFDQTDYFIFLSLFGSHAITATAAAGGEQEHGQRACQKQGNDLGKLLHRVSLQSDDFVDMFRSSKGCAPFGVLLLP